MNTFIYINGRPDHQKNHHDDCIMGVSMALYVAEKSFQSLEKVTNHTKAMINSWATNVMKIKIRQNSLILWFLKWVDITV
jgi:hypothetical protein